MRVQSLLGALIDELGLTDERLSALVEIDPRTIRKIRDDGPDARWALKKEQLYRLLIFAHENGGPLFAIKANPLWEAFEGGKVCILRGDRPEDAAVESHLATFLKNLGAVTSAVTDHSATETMMKTCNCVIIGGPGQNLASEIALSLLWGAEPFDATKENRSKLPLRFLGKAPENGKSSALLVKSSSQAIEVQTPPNNAWRRLASGSGQDGAVLVVCKQPLGTQKQVTTIIVAGYTSLATLAATRDATHGEIPDLSPLIPGIPKFAVFSFRYIEKKQGLRVVQKDSGEWGPPWPRVFHSSVKNKNARPS